MALVGKKMVEQMIKSKALVVISKSYCPFCHKVVLKMICEQKCVFLLLSNFKNVLLGKSSLEQLQNQPREF